MAILTVGPSGQEFTTIAAAVSAASAGDTIDVQAGTYNNDFLTIQQNLTLQAVNGEVVMTATQDPPDGKAIIDEGGPGINIAINGFDISGAVVPDNNGAAIRYEGGNLSLTNDYFHNNQEGLLGAADPNGSITINHSEFAFNGDGSGYTHNIYVGNIASFTITDSYVHDANVGHEIKSRAENNTITDNRIFDNNSTASYSIDLPNGGNATIANNVIEQGPNSQNPFIFAYGEEGQSNPGTNVSISGNTIVNDDLATNAVAVLNATSLALPFTNNSIYGLTASQLSSDPLADSGTVFLTSRPSLDTDSLTFNNSPVCFAAGTHILTATGERAIESLLQGDIVLTLSDGELKAQPVMWVGRRRIDLTAHPRPETVAPVRVQRGAFADNMPHTDLLVSPDHAIFVDGKLICARQLINGTSISQEKGRTSVDYFHVELDAHAILVAEGLPAESYLDTGNRGFFANSGAPLVLRPDLTDVSDYPTREAGSCAPFVWDEASVQPAWQRLADRAAAIGRPAPQRVTTTDADLRLLADRRPVKPVFSDSNLVIFTLPHGVPEVRLLSRAQSPTEARPWLEDRRRLGVCVKRIVLRGVDELREVPVDHPELTRGWWTVERGGQIMSRWTDGEAALPLPAMRGIVMLEIHLAGSMIYAVNAASEDGTERRAARAIVS